MLLSSFPWTILYICICHSTWAVLPSSKATRSGEFIHCQSLAQEGKGEREAGERGSTQYCMCSPSGRGTISEHFVARPAEVYNNIMGKSPNRTGSVTVVWLYMLWSIDRGKVPSIYWAACLCFMMCLCVIWWQRQLAKGTFQMGVDVLQEIPLPFPKEPNTHTHTHLHSHTHTHTHVHTHTLPNDEDKHLKYQ